MHLQQEQDQRLWTRTFIVVTIANFLLFVSLQLLVAPFPAYAKAAFHPGDVALGLLTSLFAVSAVAGRLIATACLRRVGRNRMLLAGLALSVVTILLYACAPTYGVFLLIRVVFGFAFGMTTTVVPTIGSAVIPGRRMGEGIGYFGLSTSLAMSIGPATGLYVLDRYGFESLTGIAAGAAAAIAPLLFLAAKLPPEPPRLKRSEARTSAGANGTMSRRTLVPAALNVLMAVTYGGLLGFLALYGEEKGIAGIGFFFMLTVVTIVIVRPLAGRLFDRKGPGYVLVPAALFLMAALLLLSYASSFAGVAAAALLYGVGFGAVQMAAQAWMLGLVSKEQHAKANGLYYNSTDIGIATGTMALGFVATAVGYAAMYRLSAAVMLAFLALYAWDAAASGRAARRAETRGGAIAEPNPIRD